MKIAAALIATLSLLIATPAASAKPPTQRQVQALKAQVKTLKRERNEWRRDAREARAAIAQALPAQVAALAQGGSISALQAAIFEPLRTDWPCGATVFQGQYSWSLDVDLQKTDYVDGEVITTTCA